MQKSNGKGKQVNESGHKECAQNAKNDAEESDAEGLNMGDLCPPGAENLSFGSFDHIEIRKLTCMHFTEQTSAIINEYGTNMCGSKFDSLAAFEAKRAIYLSGKDAEKPLGDLGQRSSSKSLSTVIEELEKEMEKERAVSQYL